MTGIVVGIAVFGAAIGWWFRYSRRMARARPPAEEAVEAYLKGLLGRLGLDPQVQEKIEQDRVTSDGCILHLDIFPGSPGDPVVVFIPGTAVYALVFAEFMYKLSLRGFHVIGFDPRGHGRSQGMRGSYTIQELVRDTRAVIAYARRRFGTEIFLAGSSQGGIVAFYTAAEEPDLKGAVCHNLAVLDDPNTTSLSRRPALARFLKRLLPLARLFSELQVPVALYLDLSKEKTRLFGNAKAFLDQDLLALRSISLKALASLAMM